jgi:hypothetical protein
VEAARQLAAQLGGGEVFSRFSIYLRGTADYPQMILLNSRGYLHYF